MAMYIQTYWVLGICPLSGILKTLENTREYQTMDRVQKPNNSKCYSTPSSEPFRLYLDKCMLIYHKIQQRSVFMAIYSIILWVRVQHIDFYYTDINVTDLTTNNS
jgi:hypothetical protein